MNRLRCSRCGKVVSNELPKDFDLIVKAFVECLDCLEKQKEEIKKEQK